MKMRGIIAITLTLCLILSSIPALAAPARDVRTMEATADEKMRTLIDIMLIASAGELFAFPETLTLAPGQQPDQALVAQHVFTVAPRPMCGTKAIYLTRRRRIYTASSLLPVSTHSPPAVNIP